MALRGARILVAGGTGFIGRSLVSALALRGANVVVLGRQTQTGLRKGVRFVRLDLLNEKETRIRLRELPSFDAVVNLASNIPPTRAQDTLDASLENVTSSLNLANSVQKADQFIYASTCEVYGRPVHIPVDESHQIAPSSFYGVGKFASEQYSRIILRKKSIPYAVARLTTVFGPNMPREIAIARFVGFLKKGKAPIVFARGMERRDYLYLDDAIEGLLRMVTARAEGTYNLASGRPAKVFDVAKSLCEISGTHLSPLVKEDKGEDFVPTLYFSTLRACRDFGFAPKVKLQEGLARTWKLSKEQNECS